MSKQHTDLSQVRQDLRQSPTFQEPKAGQPVLGYLGDLGHTYAKPEELTMEALFSMKEAPKLTQTPEQKARAQQYEMQMAQDQLLQTANLSLSGLAQRFLKRLSLGTETSPKPRPNKP